jgi:RNA polymerase sigma-70 factor (ECF subfamily)
MTSPTTDQALVDGLRAGRRAAFERLYGEYHPAIYNLCARILGDREEAKDLTQEVFIKAFDQLPAPGGEPLKLRPWLYRVATNACFNHLRSRKRLGGGGDAALEQLPSQVDAFEQAQTVALVEASLGELNERYRTALVLKDLQGVPAAEIAEVLEVSRPAADVLVHRARASFRVAFAKLAGDGAAAPAALSMVLLPLSVPAALHAMPPLPASMAPSVHAPHAPAHHGLPLPDLSSAAMPTGAGLLTKIGAALTTKAAITAAAATLVVGGGVAVHEVRSRDVPEARAGVTMQTHASAWKPASKRWLRQQARWQKYSRWSGHGWPMGHGSKGWSWNSRSGTWSWQDSMSSGSSGGSWSSGSGSKNTWRSHSGSSGSWSGSSTSSGSRRWSGGGSGSMGGSSWGGGGSGW